MQSAGLVQSLLCGTIEVRTVAVLDEWKALTCVFKQNIA